MSRSFGSWLSGPSREPSPGHPGQRLGLPADGSGSPARLGRRLGALVVDWLICYGLIGLAITMGLVPLNLVATAVLVTWFAMGVVAVRLFGFTPGQFALGLVVVSVDHRQHVGTGRAAARGALLALVIPALLSDEDLRGVHDRLTHTAVVRR